MDVSSEYSSNNSLFEQTSVKDPILPQNKKIILQGYLFKGRSKKWVTITNEYQLIYYKSKQDFDNAAIRKIIFLIFCTVQVPGNNAQNGYFSRTKATKKPIDEEEKKIFILNTRIDDQYISRTYKATSEEERDNWVNTISDNIFQSYAQSKIKKSSLQDDSVNKFISDIPNQLGNDKCAECDAKNPTWVVFNFGILVCDRCCGGHRKLGVEFTKVCSLKLDIMGTIKMEILKAFGNILVNSVMEATLALTDDKKPTPETVCIEEWLRNKYVLRKYIPPLPLINCDIQKQLRIAIEEMDRRYQLICIMNSTNVQLDSADDLEDRRNALMTSSSVGDIVMVQILLWNGANKNLQDARGENAFSLASIQQIDKTNAELIRMLEIQELLQKFLQEE